MYTYYDDLAIRDNISFNITYHSNDRSCRHDKNSCYHVFAVLSSPFLFVILLLINFKNNIKKKNLVTNFDYFFKQKVENDNITRTCIICYDNISYGDLIFTKCNHYFHEFCIRKWLSINQVCPICKRQYDVNV